METSHKRSSISAMKLALEALERYGGVDQRACDAEEALRQALETEREWVGLTLNEAEDFYDKYPDRAELINAIDKFLMEKNNG